MDLNSIFNNFFTQNICIYTSCPELVESRQTKLHQQLTQNTPKGRVKESSIFSILRGGGGRRSHSLGDFFTAQKSFVCLKEALKQTLCSLLTSDMLDIARNCHVKDKLYYLRCLSSWHKEMVTGTFKIFFSFN